MKKTSLILPTFGALALAFALGTSSAHAQIIWGDVKTISGDSDISLAGNYVDGVGGFAVGGSTVDDNGTNIRFNSVSNTAGVYSDASDDIQFSSIVGIGGDLYTGSASIPGDYDVAMLGVLYVNNGGTPTVGTVTLANLTSGDKYQVEVWKGRGDISSRDTTLVGGNSADLTGFNYVLGTFVAGSSTESFTYNADETNGAGEINTVLLRDLGAVPEPSTWAMMFAGFFGLIAWQRTRRQA